MSTPPDWTAALADAQRWLAEPEGYGRAEVNAARCLLAAHEERERAEEERAGLRKIVDMLWQRLRGADNACPCCGGTKGHWSGCPAPTETAAAERGCPDAARCANTGCSGDCRDGEDGRCPEPAAAEPSSEPAPECTLGPDVKTYPLSAVTEPEQAHGCPEEAGRRMGADPDAALRDEDRIRAEERALREQAEQPRPEPAKVRDGA